MSFINEKIQHVYKLLIENYYNDYIMSCYKPQFLLFIDHRETLINLLRSLSEERGKTI
jgi:hypothetical protein